MRLTELKEFLSNLPEEFDEFDLVNGEFGIVPELDDEMFYRIDKPILTVYIDQENKEVCLLHQTQEEADSILSNEDD